MFERKLRSLLTDVLVLLVFAAVIAALAVVLSFAWEPRYLTS